MLVVGKTLSGVDYKMAVRAIPDMCPRCHHHVQPLLRYARFDTPLPASRDLAAQLVFQCTRHQCGELFIARYTYRNVNRTSVTHVTLKRCAMTLVSTEPTSPQQHPFPTEVTTMSPRFVDIYNQAAAAEEFGLHEIAGPGYGKALEFLVKDYLIALDPPAAHRIRAEFLGTTISQRVSDPRLKACAARAAWLRNDETHYARRWEERDLQDLKTLLTLSVNWVHSSILTESFVQDMPAPTSARGPG